MSIDEQLADFLGLNIDDFEESGISVDDLSENNGNSGEGNYGYFLQIPHEVVQEVLNRSNKELYPGQILSIGPYELGHWQEVTEHR